MQAEEPAAGSVFQSTPSKPRFRPTSKPALPTAEASLWAALETGSTESILRAVRVARPMSLMALHDLVIDVKLRYPQSIADAHLRLHELLDDESAAITSDAQQQRRVRDALEKLVTTQLHPTVFGRGEGDADAEDALEPALREAREQLTPTMLGVNPAFADGSEWAASALLLRRLERYRAPADKVALLVNACRLIERRMHVLAQKANAARRERLAARQSAAEAAAASSDADASAEPSDASASAGAGGTLAEAAPLGDNDVPTVVGADEFFPVLLYVLLLAAPPSLPSELAYIGRFRHPTRLRGVSGCYYTHVRAALQFLETGAPTGWGHPSLSRALSRAPPDGNDDSSAAEGGGYFSAAHAIGLYSTGYVPARAPASQSPNTPPAARLTTDGGRVASHAISEEAADGGTDGMSTPSAARAPGRGAASSQSWREWGEWLFTPPAATPTDSRPSHYLQPSAYVADGDAAHDNHDAGVGPVDQVYGAAGPAQQPKVRIGSVFGGLMGGGADEEAADDERARRSPPARHAAPEREAPVGVEPLPPAPAVVSWRGY